MTWTYLLAIALTLILVSIVGYGTYRAAQALPHWPPDQNPLLNPLDILFRLLLIAICIGLGLLSGQSWAVLGWQAPQPLAQSSWGALWGFMLAALYILTTRWVMARSGDRYYAPAVARVIVPRSRMQLVAVALVMVTVVVLEELLFRSLLLGSLTPLAPAWFLLVAGGVIFGLMHSPQGWWGMVAIAVGGVALGLMFLWTQSLLMPMVAHYVVNMAQIVYAYRVGLADGQKPAEVVGVAPK